MSRLGLDAPRGAVIDLASLSVTWNDAGTTFTAIEMDVTDTASDAGSYLINLLIGGVSQFNVSKAGNLSITGSAFVTNDVRVGAGRYIYWAGRAQFSSPADGQVLVQNAAGNADALMQLANLTLTGLPTADPAIANRLWNDGGTVKLSAG